jgi:F-type H+-transporting ATPase subunit delta
MAAVDPAVVARALYESLQATLQSEGAEAQFDAVVESFFELTRGSGPREAEVISAVALERPQQDAIIKQLREKYGPSLDVRFVVDESILGGLIVRVGDRVLDTSVRSRLAQVQQRMLAS